MDFWKSFGHVNIGEIYIPILHMGFATIQVPFIYKLLLYENFGCCLFYIVNSSCKLVHLHLFLLFNSHPIQYIAGPTASIAELTDFICAAQMAKAADIYFQELPDESKVFTILGISCFFFCLFCFLKLSFLFRHYSRNSQPKRENCTSTSC